MPDSITDGDFSVATEISKIEPSAPIPDVNIDYLFTVTMRQEFDSFVRLDLDTAHDLIPESLLVEETTPRAIGQGLCDWQRIYARVPASHNRYESFNYEFPGYEAEAGGEEGFSGYTEGRDVFPVTATSRIQFDYYYSLAPEEIPIIEKQEYWGTGGEGFPVTGKVLGSGSSPTKADWIETIRGTEICVESSVVKPWHGNIYQRITRYMTAE